MTQKPISATAEGLSRLTAHQNRSIPSKTHGPKSRRQAGLAYTVKTDTSQTFAQFADSRHSGCRSTDCVSGPSQAVEKVGQ